MSATVLALPDARDKAAVARACRRAGLFLASRGPGAGRGSAMEPPSARRRR